MVLNEEISTLKRGRKCQKYRFVTRIILILQFSGSSRFGGLLGYKNFFLGHCDNPNRPDYRALHQSCFHGTCIRAIAIA